MKKDIEHMNCKKENRGDRNRAGDLVSVAVVGTLFFVLAAFAWIKPADTYSDSERRALKQMPAWSWESFLDGSYMSAFEGASVDQFPLREPFRYLKTMTALYGFGQQDVHDIYLYQGHLAQMDYPMEEESLKRAGNVFENIYQKYLKDTDVKTYFSIIPDKNAYMAEDSGHLVMDYELFYEKMQAQTECMEYIDITDLLELGDYYKTDSHWRQERIGDVAERLMNAMGESEDDSSKAFVEKTLERPFYGVYAGQSGLPVEGEPMVYLEHEMFDGCRVYDHEHQKQIEIYDLEKAGGKDPYEIFLSGPISLITVENPNAASEKELILFRDSFGSSIAPYFVERYKKITLVDIRYISSQMLDQWIVFDQQDVLFLYSAQVLNHSETMK